MTDQIVAYFSDIYRLVIYRLFVLATAARMPCFFSLRDRNGDTVEVILMDLSKAFDCIPHNLLIAKMKEYGLIEQTAKLMQSYLHKWKQRVKLGQFHSSWQSLLKGVPQGSKLGPVLFNIFINDLYYVIAKTTLTNYANDNTLSASDKDPDQSLLKLFSNRKRKKPSIGWLET